MLLSKLKIFVNELFLIYVNEVQHFEKHIRHPTKIDFKHDQDPNLLPTRKLKQQQFLNILIARSLKFMRFHVWNNCNFC